MAKSFLRSVTDQITGASGKPTDAQLAQAFTRFDDEQAKLLKFKREFDKYTQAILVFDNASHRFFDYIRSLTDSTWSQQPTFIQSCIDMGRIRNEHLQQLHKETNSNINLTSDLFEKMQDRINEQYQLQHDHDKIHKQYRSSVKRDEQIKVDLIKNELDQLRSALNLLNTELRDELPQFHVNLQTHYIKIILDLLDIHGKYYKSLQKLCSRSIKKFQGRHSRDLNDEENEVRERATSSLVNSDYRMSHYAPSPQSKQTSHKILHQARVIHDYKAENDDEIDLIKDEYITVIAFPNEEEYEHDKGWEYAEKSDGTIGLFPVNFAIRLYDNEEKQ